MTGRSERRKASLDSGSELRNEANAYVHVFGAVTVCKLESREILKTVNSTDSCR